MVLLGPKIVQEVAEDDGCQEESAPVKINSPGNITCRSIALTKITQIQIANSIEQYCI